MPKPLFERPAGASQHFWNNLGIGTDKKITCGLCGSKWPENSNVTLGRLLGYTIVEECCGAVFDQLYDEIGEAFATAFLEDYAKDPTNPRFRLFRAALKGAIRQALERTGRVRDILGDIKVGADKLEL